MKKILVGAMLVLGAALVSAGAVADHVRTSAALFEPQDQRVAHAPLSDSAFAGLISRVSEPGGFFDSDNLISNETGYLHPLPKMAALGVNGGVYMGVGPDQNYSYIAAVRPEIAFMIDIRRDAALQHLLYKELMTRARNRMEYLCLLFGKPVPADIFTWSTRSLPAILDQVERIRPSRALFDSTVALVRKSLAEKAHTVSAGELSTIEYIHHEFYTYGLALQYSSLNRRSGRNYPTFRSLLLERDVNGDQAGFLASEDRFQFVKSMHARNLIVPVTGNLAGKHAVREIGSYARERSLTVSAMYVSNVEYYLSREGTFPAFADNVVSLPRNSRSVIIRSVFDNTGYMRSSTRSGFGTAFSEQLLGTVDAFVSTHHAGGYRAYGDVVTKGLLPLRE
jgi:hypothetical protein